MKKTLILLIFLSFISLSEAQVGINTTTPNPNAVLDLNSNLGGTNYGGFMPPRVTLAQRDAIPVTAAEDGLIVYVNYPSGLRCLQLYNASLTSWENITCFGIPPVTGTVFLETMGTPTSASVSTSAYDAAGGFDNSAVCDFTHTSSSAPVVRQDVVSPAPASGSGNLVFIVGNRNLTISNIDVAAHSGPLTLQLYIHKNTDTANGSELTIEYSEDGITWVNVSVSNLPTTVGSAGWYPRVLATNVPNTITQIRFSRANTGSTTYRIDDIELINP